LFDISSCLSEVVAVREYNDGNITIECPWCHKGKNHFLVSTNRNKPVAHCFHCGKATNWAGLIVKIKGLNIQEARDLVDSGLYFKETKEKKKLDLPKIDFPSVTPWTDETWQYLVNRGISNKTAWEHGIYYCGSGKYGGRIILPIIFKGKRVSFQARAVNGQAKKYDNPKGFPSSRILFNYDNYDGKGKVVVVEGIFDALRLHQEGICAMATFGKEISSDQIELLVDLGVKKISLFYDPDALQKVIKLFPTLSKIMDVEVIISQDGGDPAETKMLYEALESPICSMGGLLSYSISRT
jgi:DNA primase